MRLRRVGDVAASDHMTIASRKRHSIPFRPRVSEMAGHNHVSVPMRKQGRASTSPPRAPYAACALATEVRCGSVASAQWCRDESASP
jgi:hypothetical protein